VVGIEGSETISSKFMVNAFVLSLLLIVSSDIIISFSSKIAKTEVLEDSVSELIEFMFVNFTWSLGVDLFTGGFNPFPFFFSDDVVLGFSELLKSYLDLFVREGSIVVGIEGSETIISKFMVNALMHVVFISHFLSVLSSFSSVLSSDFSITLSSHFAEIEVLEDSVSEMVKFFLVNFTWGLGVDLFAGGFNPFPLFLSDGVFHLFSEFLKSYLDLFVGEGSIVVGIEGSETISSKFMVNTLILSVFTSSMFSFLLTLDMFAEIEVFEDGVSELPEFMFVNFTWGLGVDLFAGGFNPFPFFLSDGVVHLFREFLKSYLDLFVGEGSVVVGIEVCETISSHSVADASFIFISGL